MRFYHYFISTYFIAKKRTKVQYFGNILNLANQLNCDFTNWFLARKFELWSLLNWHNDTFCSLYCQRYLHFLDTNTLKNQEQATLAAKQHKHQENFDLQQKLNNFFATVFPKKFKKYPFFEHIPRVTESFGQTRDHVWGITSKIGHHDLVLFAVKFNLAQPYLVWVGEHLYKHSTHETLAFWCVIFFTSFWLPFGIDSTHQLSVGYNVILFFSVLCASLWFDLFLLLLLVCWWCTFYKCVTILNHGKILSFKLQFKTKEDFA